MSLRPHRRVTTVTLLVLVLAVGVLVAPSPASAGSEVRREGRCSGSSHWKLEAKPDDGRIEVEAEVDSDRSGQQWRWRLVHDGSLSGRGTATTGPPSGSFEVRRRMVDLEGVDTIRFRARRASGGEVCRGRVRI